MHLFPNRTTFLQIGPLTIQWYAICLLGGALVGYFISKYRLIKKGYHELPLSDFFINLLLIGFVGARIWYVVFTFNELYAHDIMGIFKIYEGGLAIQGGLVAAILYAIYFCKKNKVDILEMGDAIMPTVLVAQAIGRWGNFINQEAYGQVMTSQQMASLPIPQFIKQGMWIDGMYRQPTFLYESILNLIGFFVIIFIVSKYLKKTGSQFMCYFIWYGIVRFFVEAYRSDSLMLGSIKMAQLTSIVFIIVGCLGLIYIYKTKKKEG